MSGMSGLKLRSRGLDKVLAPPCIRLRPVVASEVHYISLCCQHPFAKVCVWPQCILTSPLKNRFKSNHKIMTLPDPVLIFLTIVDKVIVDKYARFQLSMKHICKDFYISLEKYGKSQSAILSLL